MKFKYITTLFTVFFIGCGTEQIEIDSPHSNILLQAKGCSSISLEHAKDKALTNLSSLLSSHVKSDSTSNNKLSRYTNGYNDGYQTFSHSFNIKTAFLSIRPKFINNTLDDGWFSTKYCSTTIIDNDLLKQYIKLAKEDFDKVKYDLLFYTRKIPYSKKDEIMDKVFKKDRKYIIEYSNLYKVIRIFPTKTSLLPEITKETMSQFIKAKPSGVISVDLNNYLYNQPINLEITQIEDENPQEVFIKWKIDNKPLDEHNKNLTYNFKTPGKHKIEATLVDDTYIFTHLEKQITLKNKTPIAKFTTNKSIYRDKEPITIISTAYDPENELKNITYTYHKDGSNKVYRCDNNFTIPKNGTYIITQTVTDKYGLNNSFSQKIKISNLPPVAGFWVQPYINTKHRIYIKSTAYDPEGELKSIYYIIKNINSGESFRYNPKRRFSNPGHYKITQIVKDKYGNKASKSTIIAIEKPYLKKLYKNMSLINAQRVIGHRSYRTEKISWWNLFASNEARDFGDYWLLFYNDKLKCVVYKEEYQEHTDCNKYSKNQLAPLK